MYKKVEVEVGGKTISLETGKVAKQADGSVVMQYGDTVVLVTAVAGKENKPELGFLPLTIEYQERMASVGRVPGNYFRREIGRPSDQEVLTCRIIDRPLCSPMDIFQKHRLLPPFFQQTRRMIRIYLP